MARPMPCLGFSEPWLFLMCLTAMIPVMRARGAGMTSMEKSPR